MNDDIQNAKTIHGGEDAAMKVRVFLEKALKNSEEEAAPYVVLSYEQNGIEHNLETYGLDFAGGEKLEDVADQIIEDSEAHAERQRKRSKYVVRMKGATSRASPVVRWTLTVTNEVEDSPLDEYDEEPPTTKGIVAQMQRHDEKKTALMLQGVQITNRMTNDIVEVLQSQLAEERRENAVMRKERQDFLDMQWKRDMERQKYEDEERRRQQIMGALTTGFAMVIEHVARTSGERAAVETMKSVFHSMSPEQKMQLFTVLNDDQRSKLQSVVQAANGAPPPGVANGGPLGAMLGMMGGLGGEPPPNGAPAPPTGS